MTYTKRETLIHILAALFILLFVYAAMSKLLDLQRFRVQLGQSPLLTDLARPAAIGVPAFEMVISGMLAIQKMRLAGFYASFSLMTMFTAYIIAITRFSDNIPCSCGGILQDMNWDQHLVFNLVFWLLSLTAVMLCPLPVRISKSLLQ